MTTTYNYSGYIQTVTVGTSGTYHIAAYGAVGGHGGLGYFGPGGVAGEGAIISGDLYLQAGATLQIIVGGRGGDASYDAGGGGGGSFVIETYDGTQAVTVYEVIAGGGGGGGFVSGAGLPGLVAGNATNPAAGAGGGAEGGGGGGGFTGGGIRGAGSISGNFSGGSGYYGNGGFGGGGGGGANGGGGGGGFIGGNGGYGDGFVNSGDGGFGGTSFIHSAATNVAQQGGANSGYGLVTIDLVSAVEAAPVVTTSSGTTTAPKQVAVVVDSAVTLTDSDNIDLASATVAITSGFHSGEDVLHFSANAALYGNIVGSYDSTTGVLTLTTAGGTATTAQFQAALQSVTFDDTSGTPNLGARTISFTANDISSGSSAASKTVNVANIEAPSLVVTTLADVVDNTDGVTSLREAIAFANSHTNANASTPDKITFAANLAGQTVNVADFLPVITDDLVIDGQDQNIAISGGNQTRIFFVGGSTAGTDVTIRDLKLADGYAKGGDGGSGQVGPGGGGLGAGGAVFVRTGASVVLDNVVFDSNAAQGGNAGAFGNFPLSAGGGGGLGGNGGGAANTTTNAGGGGGGAFADAASTPSGSGTQNGSSTPYRGSGGTGAGPNGGAGGAAGQAGQDGGDLSGGGGGGNNGSVAAIGGDGGFGGGGGGGTVYDGVVFPVSSQGGSGGFGGGGGSGHGSGGFGGGGGASGSSLGNVSGQGGFGGSPSGTNGGTAGAGAGFGGAVFVMDGASLTITGAGSASNGSVVGGTGHAPGSAAGSFLFLQQGTTTFAPGAGQQIAISDTIADDFGNTDANNDGVAGDNSAGGGLTINGATTGTVVLSGANSYHGATTVAEGTLQVDGSIANSAVTVQSGGTLKGHGTVGALTIQSGAHFAAGNSPGVMHTGNLSLVSGASFDEEIGGTAAGTGYDQTSVTGSVALNNATLNVLQYASFVPSAGQSFTVIDNDGADAVVGTFNGLAEGATVTLAGQTLKISYVGGDGNDVTLTDIAVLDQVTAITTSPTSGATVARGGTVVFTLTPQQAVTVTGQPELTLSNGGVATYSGMDANGHPQFTYTVAVGQDTSDLKVTGFDYNGGTVTSPGQTNFAPQTTVATGDEDAFVTAADLNGDGKVDLVALNFNPKNVSVLLGNGDGTFQAQQTFPLGVESLSAAMADLNGDGKLDLIAANYNGNNVSVLLGNGDGTFQAQQLYATGFATWSVATADLNGDGKPDIVAANAGDDTLSVLLGNGDGTFQTQHTFPTDIAPTAVTTADFNGDGKLDLVAANQSVNNVSVLLGNGDGTFQAQQTFAAGASPESIVTAEVNGDGNPDLIVGNRNGNNVSVLLGNGDGTFQAQHIYAVGSVPRSVTTADLNGDGKLDLVAANQSANNVSVLLGNGDGTFQAQQTFLVGSLPVSVTAADLNGDGKPDLAVANVGDDNVSVLLGASTHTETFDPTTIPSLAGADTGIVVDATAPVFQSAAVSGNSMVLTYSEPLDATHLPLANAFTVLVNGASDAVTAAAVTGSTLVLTLGTAVVSGDVVKLSYADPTAGDDANATQDVAGNDAASLSNQAVTNTVVNVAPTSTGNAGTVTSEDMPTLVNGLSVNDVDNSALTVSLSVTHGSLTLGTWNGLQFSGGSDGLNDASMSFSGSVADLNAALASLVYTNIEDFNGADALTFTVSDGIAQPVVRTVALTVTPVVDIHTDSVTTNANTPVTINANLNDTFENPGHAITAINGTSIQVGQSVVTGDGSLLLRPDGQLTFTPNNNFSGQTSFNYTVTSGGVDETTGVTVGVNAVNVAPVLTGDHDATVNEGGNVVITTTDLNFTDSDDNAAGVTFTVSNATNGAVLVNGVVALTFSGTQLASGLVSFQHNGSETTAASFNVSVEDGNEDGSMPVAQAFNLTVNPVNDDPAATGMPSDVTVNGGVASNVDLSGMTFSDVDSGIGNVVFKIAASAGALSATSSGSVTVGGTGTATLTLTGTAADIDAFLNNVSNIKYTSPNGAVGNNTGTLTLSANDGGHTGSGGGTDVALGTVNLDINASPEAHSLVVTTLEDKVDAFDGQTSLREAVAYANQHAGADAITFAPNLTGTVRLTGGTLTVTDAVTIDGAGHITMSGDVDDNDTTRAGTDITDLTATLAANLSDNVRLIDTAANLTLIGLTLTGGHAVDRGGAVRGAAQMAVTIENSTISGNGTVGGSSYGGAIYGSTIVATGSTFSDNHSEAGGGAISGSSVTLTDSTVSGNSSVSIGGGVTASGITLTNSTITGNSTTGASGVGGGVYAETGTVTNSIILGNVAQNANGDEIVYTYAKVGGNIIGHDGGGADVFNGSNDVGDTTAAQVFANTVDIGNGVLAGVLASNGGAVQTVKLNANVANPALDASDDSAPSADARGQSAFDVVGVDNNGTATSLRDLGAYEVTGLVAEAQSLVVTTLADVVDAYDGKTSLREAIAYANEKAGADIVTFAQNLSGGTVTAFSGTLDNIGDLTINGDVDGNNTRDITIAHDPQLGASRFSGGDITLEYLALDHVSVSTGGTATISHSLVTGSSASLSADFLVIENSVVRGTQGIDGEDGLSVTGSTIAQISGGSGTVLRSLFGTATISNSAVIDSFASGGQVIAGNAVFLENTTVSGNDADYGAAIGGNTVTVTNSTITGNVVIGAVVSSGGDLTISNSIVLGNATDTFNRNPLVPLDNLIASGTTTLSGGNIIGMDVFSGANHSASSATAALVFASTVDIGNGVIAGLLANNGGPVQTVALNTSATNPALDASNGSAPTSDARGEARYDQNDVPNANGGAADLGAYEVSGDSTPPALTINVIAGNDIVNAAEGAAAITVSGTALGAEDGRIVTLTLETADGTPLPLPQPVTAVVNNGTWSVDVPAGTTPAFPDGDYIVAADVSDAAGNPAPQATRTIHVDVHAPSITIDTIGGNDVVNTAEGAAAITVSGTAVGAEDGRTVTLALKTPDGSTTLQTLTTTVSGGLWHLELPAGATPAFPDGQYRVTADVSDAAGNPATEATRTITVDTHAPLAPTVALTSDTGSSATDHITSNSAISYGRAEAGGTLLYAADGAANFTAAAPNFAGDGVHTVLVKQQDAAGNVGAVSSLTFVFDTTAPHLVGVSATPAGGNHAAGSELSFTLAFDEAVTVGGGTPSLHLSNGSTAIYDAAATAALGDAFKFVFDTIVGSNDAATSSLAITGIDLHGALLGDLAGNAADFSGLATTFGGLAVNVPVVDNESPPAEAPYYGPPRSAATVGDGGGFIFQAQQPGSLVLPSIPPAPVFDFGGSGGFHFLANVLASAPAASGGFNPYMPFAVSQGVEGGPAVAAQPFGVPAGPSLSFAPADLSHPAFSASPPTFASDFHLV